MNRDFVGLTNASLRGEIAPDTDIEGEANFLTSHAIGQLTLVRSKAAPDIVESAAEIAIDRIASLSW